MGEDRYTQELDGIVARYGVNYGLTRDAIVRDDEEQFREIEWKVTWELEEILPAPPAPRTHDEWIARAREHVAAARREEAMLEARARHADTVSRQGDFYTWLAEQVYTPIAWTGTSYRIGEFGPTHTYTLRRLKWWERALDRCGLAMWRMRYAGALRRLRRRVQRTDRQVLGIARRVLDGDRVEVDLDADRDRANALTRIWGA